MKQYLCIDLKSYYASYECASRGLDPLKTNLVVADETRTEKTICLAVSPPLKAYGIPGRARLFEVLEKVKEINAKRKTVAKNGEFTGKSVNSDELSANSDLELDFIIAPPRMRKYMECSAKIYSIYLKFIAPEDIHVYSIDEVFIDVTGYLRTYKMTSRELAAKMIGEVFAETGITATCGIGTNLYLAKIALDIIAKHETPDENGARIGELDEMSYRRKLWEHRPLTDFWRIGGGYGKSLEKAGMYTMGDVARCSVGKPSDFYNEELLYKMFGVNAELLIDHAWGYEPCSIADIKAYKPRTNSLSSGQVLKRPYTTDETRLIVREMADLLSYDLVRKHLVTNQIVLYLGYDVENVKNSEIKYTGEVTTDRYGRRVPKHSNGSENLDGYTSSTRRITEGAIKLYDRIAREGLLIRRLSITAEHIIPEGGEKKNFEQLDLFTDYEKLLKEREKEQKERSVQRAIVEMKKKYGKNAIVKGMNLKENATAMERNGQVGGHKE